MTDSIDVLVLGGAGVDTVVQVPVLPLPLADSYLVPGIVTRAGQTGDNVALGVQALGLRTRLIDVLGDDPEGALVRDLHARYGVDFTRSPLRPAPSAPSTWSTPRVSDSRSTTAGANPYHEVFAVHADLVFLSTAALEDHEATLRRILARGRAQLAIATAGANGAYLLERGGSGVQHIPARTPAAPVIDTNGAGDAFVAGFLSGFLAGRDPATSGRMGADAAAHACTVPSF